MITKIFKKWAEAEQFGTTLFKETAKYVYIFETRSKQNLHHPTYIVTDQEKINKYFKVELIKIYRPENKY